MYNSQEVANVIKLRAKAKKIAIGTMLSDCGLSKNTLSSMQSGGYLPRAETLIKIADYLNCSVDYLLGRTNIPDVNAEKSNNNEKNDIIYHITLKIEEDQPASNSDIQNNKVGYVPGASVSGYARRMLLSNSDVKNSKVVKYDNLSMAPSPSSDISDNNHFSIYDNLSEMVSSNASVPHRIVAVYGILYKTASSASNSQNNGKFVYNIDKTTSSGLDMHNNKFAISGRLFIMEPLHSDTQSNKTATCDSHSKIVSPASDV